MSALFDDASLEWQPVRPDVAEGVFGKTLFDDKIKIVLTRVVPNGKFRPHRDKYSHVFYFLSGEGMVTVGEQQSIARAGVVARVDAGELHAYENISTDDLLLISSNIPT